MGFEKDKEWKVLQENTDKVAEISGAFNINLKISTILVNRGIDTIEKVNTFLYGGLDCLHNPFLFHDMQKAADRIRKAIDTKEQILVYGDRDVDSVTTVNVIVNSIRLLGGNVHWYVPEDEGYGAIKYTTKYAAENVKLMITVDCGISLSKKLNMQIIRY